MFIPFSDKVKNYNNKNKFLRSCKHGLIKNLYQKNVSKLLKNASIYKKLFSVINMF